LRWATAVALTLAFTFPVCALAVGKKAEPQSKTGQPLPLVPRDKWALLVGVGNYKDSSFGALRNAARNVSSLAIMLRNPDAGRFAPDHIVSLVDEDATTDAIRSVIFKDGLIKKALPNDLIVLYFFGAVLPSSDHADAVFCTYDTRAMQASATGVPLKRLLADLYSRTQSKNIICLLDTSPAQVPALATDLQSSDLPRVEHISTDCHVTVLSANQLFQPSYNSPTTANTLFCRYLTDGIQTGAGQEPIGDIAAYVAENVKSDATKILKKSEAPIFTPIADNPSLIVTPFGCPSKVASIRPVKFGHPLDSLALNRPDLMLPKTAAPQPDDADDDQPGPDGRLNLKPYVVKMKKEIQAKWKPLKGFEERRVVAVFSIMRDGRIAEPSIVESSGVDAVDKTALDALQAASPLDPLPHGAPKSVQIRYQFDWRVSHQ